VQGLIKNSFLIEGRTRILELEKFLNEVILQGRKIIAPFRLELTFSNDDNDNTNTENSSNYKKFCEEFTSDQRAGISNISNVTQVYIVPPLLMHYISLLDNFAENNNSNDINNEGLKKDENINKSFLYGIIVSKEAGPKIYTTAAPSSIVPVTSHQNSNNNDNIVINNNNDNNKYIVNNIIDNNNNNVLMNEDIATVNNYRKFYLLLLLLLL
jgi:hypothetical protein